MPAILAPARRHGPAATGPKTASRCRCAAYDGLIVHAEAIATAPIDPQAAYRAVVAHDARFDGRLFVGVTSTGVYCRPVCRVRTPMQRNCRFFHNAPSAEAAGFRPCLRCRPELAPGLSLVDSPQVLAQQAARLIDEAARAGDDVYLPDVAARLGVTDRHLRRIFAAVHGVSPIDYLTTQRLLLAKRLLTDTPLPVTAVAHASGFSSLRRFNDAFATRYRMSPTALRKQRGFATRGSLVLRLAYRPPYDIDALLRFFAARRVAGVESVDVATQSLRRTLSLQHRGEALRGWLAGRYVPDRHEFELQVAASLLPALGTVLERVRQGLDLDADPSLIDPAMAALPGPALPGLRVPNGIDGFESAVRVILGQQVTVAAARTLTSRLVERFGAPIATPHEDLTRCFPDAATLAGASAEAIGTLGIVRQRVGALRTLAREVAEGRIALHRGAPLMSTLDALRALPGVGEWTVQLIAMRALAWPDAFPATDIGVMNALGTRDAKAVAERAEAWRPWRSYAVMKLWQSLETGT
jgi:AraC family transcriptional regulator of adaptative response / DNA-3-methyladenine glycosylase II